MARFRSSRPGQYAVWVHLRAKGGIPPHLLVTVGEQAALAVLPRAHGEWEWGHRLDICASPAWNWSTPSIGAQFVGPLDSVRLPAHEYEFTHAPALEWWYGCYANGAADLCRIAPAGKAVVLTWGECLAFAR